MAILSGPTPHGTNTDPADAGGGPAQDPELALRRLSAVVDTLPDAVIAFDGEGRCRHANVRAEALLGRDRASMLGRTAAELLPDAHAVRMVADALKLRHVRLGEWREPRRPCRVVPQPVGDCPGAVLFVGDTARGSGAPWIRHLAEHAPAVFWVRTTTDRALVYLSPVYAEVWGQPATALDGSEPMLDSVVPADRDRLVDALHGAVEQAWTREYRIIRPDGSLRSIRDRGFPITDAHGAIRAIGGWAEDVTETRQAEAAFRREQALNREALRAARMVYYQWDPERDEVTFTASAGDVLGFTRTTMTFEEAQSTVHHEDRAAHEAQLRKVLTQGGDYASSYRRLHQQTGQLLYIEGRGRAELGPDGRVQSLVGVMVDVTHLRRTEQALAQSELLFRALVERSTEIVAITDEGLAFRYVSPSVQAILGYPPGELVGERLLDRVHHDEVAMVRERLEALCAQPGGADAFPLRMQHASGAWRHLEVSAANQLADPDIGGIVANVRDVTERVEASARLAQHHELMHRAEREQSLGTLAGHVAHDFNNNLTGIIAYAQLALEQARDDDPLREDLAEILKIAKTATGTTRQLLIYSRRQVVDPQVVDLNALLEDQRRLIARMVGETVDVRVVAEPGLGLVYADPQQVNQLLLNLAINARDAMLPRGGELTFQTQHVVLDAGHPQRPPAIPPGRYVCLSVRDTGAGMPPEVQQRIFEPFFTTKPVGKGTGLGLATALSIVERMDGTIQVRSRVGEGTTFFVYIPICDEAESTPPEEPCPVPETGHGKIALVVEDEISVRAAEVRMLQRLGFTVHQAENGRRGLAVAQGLGKTLDLILTDVIMPEMGGPEMIAAVYEAGLEPAIVYCSGYTDGLLPASVLADDAVYLEKPFQAAALADRVQTALTASALRRAPDKGRARTPGE